ncbi:MAG: TMEM175 family protein [Pseudomonadota bacterium]
MRAAIASHLDHDPHFEWRGQNVTRIENLSDIVFALALGMLLLTGAPPQTYSELLSFLGSFVPVAAGFAVLFSLWNAHFTFFRRYGLADRTVVFLNSILLLLVLFIAYPLRFIFDSLYGYVLGSITGDWTKMMAAEMSADNTAVAIAIFAAAFFVIETFVSMLYAHALAKSHDLNLDAIEQVLTRRSVWRFRADAAISLTSGICALTTPMGPFAGLLMAFGAPAAIGARLAFPLPGEPNAAQPKH